jgi:hypothetical protein
MKLKILFRLAFALVICCLTWTVQGQGGESQAVQPMYGGLLIDGYDFKKDIGPKGTILYDKEANEFRGTYIGLRMPKGRRAIFAWLHDTVNQKSEYLGPVGWLKVDTGGKRKGKFQIKVPNKFKGGNFGNYEIIGFTSEKTSYLKNGTEVVEVPKEPSGSDILAKLKPAFYLFAALPGADTGLHYCGHGQDFFYAKDLDKQFCYD